MGIRGDQPMITGLFLHPCGACQNWIRDSDERFVCAAGHTPPDGFAQPPCYALDPNIAQADRDAGAAIVRRAIEIRADRSDYMDDLLLAHAKAVRERLAGNSERADELTETAAILLVVVTEGVGDDQLQPPTIINTEFKEAHGND